MQIHYKMIRTFRVACIVNRYESKQTIGAGFRITVVAQAHMQPSKQGRAFVHSSF